LPDYVRRSKINSELISLSGLILSKSCLAFFGRMDGDAFFKCAVTTLSPLLKNQWPLHPSVGNLYWLLEAQADHD
jgi:hypothetical protein